MRIVVGLGALLCLVLPTLTEAAEPCSAEGGWDCPPLDATLEPLVVGEKPLSLGTPTALLFAPIVAGGPEHVIVAEKDGTVTAYDRATGAAKQWLALDGVASINPERGLLGLALHPDFTAGRSSFVTYHTIPRTNEANMKCRRLPPPSSKKFDAICDSAEVLGCGGSFVVTEWTVDPIAEDPSASVTGREILKRPQPGEGHNAGHVLFGPDGMLYVSVGDGGAQNDPCSRGQDLSTPWSAILRLDIDADGALPKDNPFVGTEGAEPLVYAYGFRNPWRMTFTPAGVEGVPADVLLVGDTGQSRREEIDVVTAGGNYGWSVREGTLNHPDAGVAPIDAAFTAPLFEYGSGEGKASPTGGFAVIGGVVATSAPFAGMYFFGDNVTGKLRALDLRASDLGDAASWNGAAKAHLMKGCSVTAATFGRDAAGDVYVAGSGGKVFRITPGS